MSKFVVGEPKVLIFVAEEPKTKVLIPDGGVTLGYIEDNIFTPNNCVMFNAEWLVEIARFMGKMERKRDEERKRDGIPMLEGVTAHYEIKGVKL